MQLDNFKCIRKTELCQKSDKTISIGLKCLPLSPLFRFQLRSDYFFFLLLQKQIESFSSIRDFLQKIFLQLLDVNLIPAQCKSKMKNACFQYLSNFQKFLVYKSCSSKRDLPVWIQLPSTVEILVPSGIGSSLKKWLKLFVCLNTVKGTH